MRKRQKFVLTTVLLTLGFVLFGRTPLEFKYIAAAILSGLTYVLFAWSLREGLNGVEWLTLLLPPTLFTLGFCLFSILVPADWVRGLPYNVSVGVGAIIVHLIFAIGQYGLLLTSNIFSVAAIRTIALFWTATAISFVITVTSGFFWYETILSFRLPFYIVGIAIGLISFLLILPAVWSVHLENKISKRVLMYSFVLAFLIGGIAVSLSFWPASVAVGSLFLATCLYVFLGITQHHLSEKLFIKTVWEYLIVGIVVLVTMLITSAYGA